MRISVWAGALAFAALLAGSASAAEKKPLPDTRDCITCHEMATPGIVKEFRAGVMGGREKMDCSDCHGSGHTGPGDLDKVAYPTIETCAACHEDNAKRYDSGKHAAAWVAMDAMPTTAIQPHPYIQGLKGCGGCHKVGRRDQKQGAAHEYGMACDSCHTRHRFSRAEALRPEACQTCHMGFDHPQWEMWSSSKHGVIWNIEKDTGRAPTCQTCHMPGGDHRVMTSWGFLAVRLPEDDKEWMGYRATILKGLQVLDEKGNPTARLEVVKAGNVARLTKEDWQAERDRMLAVCTTCHGSRFARQQLANGDAMIKEADKLMAEAIEVVAGLYRDKLLAKRQETPNHYPDLLTFYEAPTPVEQKLFVMFLEHRMRAFQGAFHMNPDYVTWYGLSELKMDLAEIKHEAERIRAEKKARK